MSRYFWVGEDDAVTEKLGGYVDAAPRWALPGVRCPACGATWSSIAHSLPGVDLSSHPSRGDFETARPEPLDEFIRLRELIRPLVPSGTVLPPGTGLGPLVGRASGSLADFTWLTAALLVRDEALERLTAEGLRGLRGHATELRHRQKNPPLMRELQLEPSGLLHPDCIPPGVPPPCQACGRFALSRPQEPILDAGSLPEALDLFRLGNFATLVIGTEQFKKTVQALGLRGLTFRELPIR